MDRLDSRQWTGNQPTTSSELEFLSTEFTPNSLIILQCIRYGLALLLLIEVLFPSALLRIAIALIELFNEMLLFLKDHCCLVNYIFGIYSDFVRFSAALLKLTQNVF